MISYPIGAGGMITRVLDAGDGVPTLLLLHGIGARADRFVRNLDALASGGLRVIAVDLPGHGFATKASAGPGTVPELAEFVLDVLDVLEVERATLVGTSLGGHVSATMACVAPERVDRLVLVGTLGITALAEERCERMRERVRDTTLEGIRAKLMSVVHDPGLVTEDWIREEHRVNNSPGARAALAMLADYLADRLNADVVGDRLARLGTTMPTLLLWGAADRSVPLEDGHAAQAVLPNAPLAIIDAAAHVPYFEQPGAFNSVVAAFVAGDPLEGLPAPEVTINRRSDTGMLR